MMKPIEHPEFFRMAPPPGASRDSTIHLDREGRFFHDGELVEHVPLRQALAQWISVHPDSGRPILTNGYDWCYFTFEDTPMIVSALDAATDPPTLVLLSEAREPLAPATLSVDEEGVVHCRVSGGKLDARMSRHAQTQLAPFVGDDGESLTFAGTRYHLPLRQRPE